MLVNERLSAPCYRPQTLASNLAKSLWALKLTGARTREEAHAQAEEILHEAVAQAFAKLDTYDPAHPAVNWLLGFAINIIRQMKRHQGREAAKANHILFDKARLVDRLHGQTAQLVSVAAMRWRLKQLGLAS